MLKPSINKSNAFLCDSLLCIIYSKKGLITVYIIVWNILGMVYPERSTCNLLYFFFGGGGGESQLFLITDF